LYIAHECGGQCASNQSRKKGEATTATCLRVVGALRAHDGVDELGGHDVVDVGAAAVHQLGGVPCRIVIVAAATITIIIIVVGGVVISVVVAVVVVVAIASQTAPSPIPITKALTLESGRARNGWPCFNPVARKQNAHVPGRGVADLRALRGVGLGDSLYFLGEQEAEGVQKSVEVTKVARVVHLPRPRLPIDAGQARQVATIDCEKSNRAREECVFVW
jgi:hypothetical protein